MQKVLTAEAVDVAARFYRIHIVYDSFQYAAPVCQAQSLTVGKEAIVKHLKEQLRKYKRLLNNADNRSLSDEELQAFVDECWSKHLPEETEVVSIAELSEFEREVVRSCKRTVRCNVDKEHAVRIPSRLCEHHLKRLVDAMPKAAPGAPCLRMHCMNVASWDIGQCVHIAKVAGSTLFTLYSAGAHMIVLKAYGTSSRLLIGPKSHLGYASL